MCVPSQKPQLGSATAVAVTLKGNSVVEKGSEGDQPAEDDALNERPKSRPVAPPGADEDSAKAQASVVEIS